MNYKKFFFCFFAIIISYICQVSVFSFFEIGGIKPNLMIMITSMIGFMMGSKAGIFTGFFAGLLVDLMAGGTVGFSSLVFIYLGWFNGLFYKDYIKEELFLPVTLVVGGVFMYEFLFYVFCFLLQNKLNLPFYLRRIIIPEILYTVIVTLIIYIFVYYIIRKLEQNKKRRSKTVA